MINAISASQRCWAFAPKTPKLWISLSRQIKVSHPLEGTRHDVCPKRNSLLTDVPPGSHWLSTITEIAVAMKLKQRDDLPPANLVWDTHAASHSDVLNPIHSPVVISTGPIFRLDPKFPHAASPHLPKAPQT